MFSNELSSSSPEGRRREASEGGKTFPGGSVVQLIAGDPGGLDAHVVTLSPASIRLGVDRIVATTDSSEWSWLFADIERVFHGGDEPWMIFEVPAVPDMGLSVRVDDLSAFRGLLHQVVPGAIHVQRRAPGLLSEDQGQPRPGAGCRILVVVRGPAARDCPGPAARGRERTGGPGHRHGRNLGDPGRVIPAGRRPRGNRGSEHLGMVRRPSGSRSGFARHARGRGHGAHRTLRMWKVHLPPHSQSHARDDPVGLACGRGPAGRSGHLRPVTSRSPTHGGRSAWCSRSRIRFPRCRSTTTWWPAFA